MWEKNELPLHDITILDLSWVLAGPYATRLFADLGANVIKVESRKTFDVVRSGAQRQGNEDPRVEGGWAYNDMNRGKSDIAINLKSEKGRQAFEELLAKADIMICNYGPRAFHKLRLTYDDLKAVKPDIILLNASGLGDWGPWSSYVTFAPVLQALTGIEATVGYEGEEPYDEYPPISDYIGALTAANCLLGALEYRHRTGKGQFIDLSQGEAAAALMGSAVLDWQVNAEKKGCLGNRHYAGDIAPHNCYRCKGEGEQWCVISCADEAEWQALRKVVDPQGLWSGEARFADAAVRVQNAEELDRQVERWTREHAPMEAAELLQAAGVSAAPVQYALDSLFHDEHKRQRGFFVPVDFPPSHKSPETFLVTSTSIRITGVPPIRQVEPGPSVGRDTDVILREVLGKSQEWIDDAAKEEAFV